MSNKKEKAVPATGIETPEELQAINAALEKTIEEQAEEIKQLKAQVGAASKAKRPVSTEPEEFTFEKKTYKFPAPKFRVPGYGIMTATEALEKPEVLAYLVEVKAGPIE